MSLNAIKYVANSGYTWEPNQERELGQNQEEIHQLAFKNLIMQYPRAYSILKGFTEEDMYLYFLLTLLDHVPSNQKEQVFEYLTSALLSLKVVKIDKEETTQTSVEKCWDKIEKRQIPQIELFLRTLGFEFFVDSIINECNYSLNETTEKLLHLFMSADNLEIIGSENWIDTFELLARQNEKDLTLLVTDALQFKKKVGPVNKEIISSIIRIHYFANSKQEELFYTTKAFEICLFYAKKFPKQSNEIFSMFKICSEEMYEILFIYKNDVLNLISNCNPDNLLSTLFCITQLKREDLSEWRIEKAKIIIKKLGMDEGENLARIISDDDIIKINIDEISVISQLIKKYNLEANYYLLHAILRVPEHQREEIIQLGLKVFLPETLGSFLLETSDSNKILAVKFIYQYNLLSKVKFYDSLSLILTLSKINETQLKQFLPLINFYDNNMRGELVKHINLESFRASPEKITNVLKHMTRLAITSHTPQQMAELVNYLLKEENYKKIVGDNPISIEDLMNQLDLD